MTQLTLGAQGRLNEYLNEMRRAISGSPAVNAGEVERDVRDHIDAALAGHAGPVDASALNEILSTLGSPDQWLPEGEIPWYRRPLSQWPGHFKQVALRAGRRFAAGPESYRLGYLSLLVLSAGWFLMPSGHGDEASFRPMIATIISFILARAALTLFDANRLTVGQKWLLYPGLLAFYIPVALIIMTGPVVIAGAGAVYSFDEFRHKRERLNDRVRELSQRNQAAPNPQRDAAVRELENYPQYPKVWIVSLTPVVLTFGLIAVAGAAWFLLGLFGALFPGAVCNVFFPFANGFSRRTAFGLAVLGLFMSFGGLVVFM